MTRIIIVIVTVFIVAGCNQMIKPDTPRTITLNDEKITEKTPGQFWSWRCNDYINGGKTIIEVGLTEHSSKLLIGYVLYDGTDEGTWTIYQRKGINHRWDWGPDGIYAFVLKADGTGLYYDFSTVKDGETTKPNEIVKCSKY